MIVKVTSVDLRSRQLESVDLDNPRTPSCLYSRSAGEGGRRGRNGRVAIPRLLPRVFFGFLKRFFD